jgi:hypothetical protein
MPRTFDAPPARLVFALVAFVALVLFFSGEAIVTRLVGGRLRAAAHARGYDLAWSKLVVGFPLDVRFRHLTLVQRASGDTTLAADTLAVTISPLSLLAFHPRPGAVAIAHARFMLPRRAAAEPDTLAPEREESSRRGEKGPAAGKVLRAADAAVRTLLLPARRLPRITIADLTVSSRGGREDDETPARNATLHWLELTPDQGGVRLAGSGVIRSDHAVPFDFSLDYGRDDRLRGGARFLLPDPDERRPAPLLLAVDGRIEQDRHAGELRIADSTHVTIGGIPLDVSAALRRRGPSLTFRLAADGITPERFQRGLPAPLLGPLADVSARGSWDYRLSLDLDLVRPDSVDFHADVIPHGLALDFARTSLPLGNLDQPFVAVIHLPHDRIVTRDLSPANPHFLPLDRMDSLLVHAVLTNEDGGFYHHRGFSTDAVKGAIAHNLRVGAYRRGAGTITMQLARNLYLGHERTLARKAQEVILAWTLEHLTGVSKQRLLEIYLNVIEWGPDVHGADEAAEYYFGHGARHVSVSEALFLTIVVPSPSKWRWRFGKDGELREFARAQMHFIGRAMVAKGWLREDELPAADELEVKIRGPARDVLFPPEAAADSVAAVAAAAAALLAR